MEEVGIVANWGNADFSELLQLQKKLNHIQTEVERFCKEAARELAPVGIKPRNAPPEHWDGYVGGTLRRGWTAKTEEEAKSNTRATNGAEYAKSLPVYRNGGNYTIVVKNPVRYASYVEYGHRQTPGRYVPALGKQLKAAWVNGRYMLTISEQELRGQSQGILEKKLTAFLQEVFRGK